MPSKWHTAREAGPSWEEESRGLVTGRERLLPAQANSWQPPGKGGTQGPPLGKAAHGSLQACTTAPPSAAAAAAANASTHIASTYSVPGTGQALYIHNNPKILECLFLFTNEETSIRLRCGAQPLHQGLALSVRG